MMKIKRICKTCGKEFSVWPSKIKDGGGKHCSLKCSVIMNNRNRKGTKHRDSVLVKKKCETCGNYFMEKPSRISEGKGKYCSRKCRYTGETHICKCCGNKFYVRQSAIKNGEGKYCSSKCRGKSQSGINANNYKHGQSKTKEYKVLTSHKRRVLIKNNGGEYTITEWNKLKKEYKKTCPMCGRKEPSIKLTVDHIVPISKGGNNSIGNIQPLCMKCNLSKNVKIFKVLPNGQLSMMIGGN